MLPPEGWSSLASCRSSLKTAVSAGPALAGIGRCIWLLLGTGQRGRLKISEAELPPSVSAGW